jgi:CDP-diacylglycerol--serine O-phosphatidyltransferase
MAFSLLSHSPAEIIFIILLGYLLSGYVNFFKENFKFEKNRKKK